MANCDSKIVSSEKGSEENENFLWKPVLRCLSGVCLLTSVLVCSAAWISILLYGLSIGAPTVFIPQIRKEHNSTAIITENMASWLTSTYSFSGFPFVIVICLMTKFYGRKITFLVAIAATLISFTVLYYSANTTHLLISLVIQGFFSASQTVLPFMVLTEYVSPKYRGLFLTLKSSTLYWGILASNVIGTFLHWKIIPLFGKACASVTLLIIILSPKSPYWLASVGKFEECAISHRWLKGCDKESEEELEALINSQKEYIASSNYSKMTLADRAKDFFKTIKSKKFYKPTVLSAVTGCITLFTGKLVCALYALDIIKRITNSESTAYIGMLTLDGITILSMYVGSALARFLKRRPLLLVTSSVGAIFLFILSFYLYLIKLEIIIENKYVSIFLLTLLSIAVGCGPLVLSISACGELILLRSRNLASCFIALFGKLLTAICLKIAPTLFKTFGLHGFFLIFGICSTIIIIILNKYLPETKDKTLQEIADSIIRVNGLKNVENTKL